MKKRLSLAKLLVPVLNHDVVIEEFPEKGDHSSTAIVFHGMASHTSDWKQFSELFLNPDGVRVLSVPLPGHVGSSDFRSVEMSQIDDYCRSIVDDISRFKQQNETSNHKIMLAGLSLGAAFARTISDGLADKNISHACYMYSPFIEMKNPYYRFLLWVLNGLDSVSSLKLGTTLGSLCKVSVNGSQRRLPVDAIQKFSNFAYDAHATRNRRDFDVNLDIRRKVIIVEKDTMVLNTSTQLLYSKVSVLPRFMKQHNILLDPSLFRLDRSALGLCHGVNSVPVSMHFLNRSSLGVVGGGVFMTTMFYFNHMNSFQPFFLKKTK